MIQISNNAKSLRDAMYAMSLSKKVPDADLVEEFALRYPQHAAALTDFAIELAIDGLMFDDDEEVEIAGDPDAVSPAVSRVMSLFENRLFEVRQGQRAAKGTRASNIVVENPFVRLDRDQFRTLAARVGINTVFLSKLRDRQIDPPTIPDRFSSYLADEMGEEHGSLTAHLCATPEIIATRQFYKAERKPVATTRQSFDEAVQGSGLSKEQQARLLAFRD
jgi:hypothetical protein